MRFFRLPGSEWAKIHMAAREYVRQQLSERQEIALDALVAAAGVSTDRQGALQCLLKTFSDETGVSLLALQPNEKLGDAFRVTVRDLTGATNSYAGAYSSLPEQFEAFGNDLLYALEEESSAGGWNQQWSLLECRPNDDDERLDALMAMSLLEFIQFVTPMLDD